MAGFAARVENLQPSSIRKMMAIARRLIGEGRFVHELNIGQPDVPCHPAFVEAVTRRASHRSVAYSPYIGETYLRETYARYLNVHFDRRQQPHLVVDIDNVMVANGGSHALSCTFLTLCEPGDEILVVEPFFPPYIGFLAVAGGVLKPIPTFANEGFALPDDDAIKALITPRTRAILFNSPCNPSGKIFSADEVTRLARIAVEHDLFLISDEVYREFYLSDSPMFSALQVELSPAEMEIYKHRLIVIDSASKSFSLCGARVGFVVSRPEVIAKIALVAAHTVASVSDLMQYGVAVAYDSVLADDGYFETLRGIYRQRLDETLAAARQYLPGAVVPRPTGAFYAMVQLPWYPDVTEFSMWMLEHFNLANETVAVTPAASFYLTPGRGRNEFRVGIVVDHERLRRSMQIIGEADKAYRQHLERSKQGRLTDGKYELPGGRHPLVL